MVGEERLEAEGREKEPRGFCHERGLHENLLMRSISVQPVRLKVPGKLSGKGMEEICNECGGDSLTISCREIKRG